MVGAALAWAVQRELPVRPDRGSTRAL